MHPPSLFHEALCHAAFERYSRTISKGEVNKKILDRQIYVVLSFAYTNERGGDGNANK